MRSLRIAANKAVKVFSPKQEVASYFKDQLVIIPGIGKQTEIAINGNIKILDLEDRAISSEGAKVVAELLKQDCCKDIEHIDLGRNLLRDEDVEIIVAAIKQANLTKLRVLGFDYNLIRARGAASVLSLLHEVKFAKEFELHLNNNKFGDKGIQALAYVLQHPGCKSKVRLNFSNVGMKEKGAIILLRALANPHCPKGLRLWLDGNLPRHAELIKRIENRIKENGKLYVPTRSGFKMPLSITPDKKRILGDLKGIELDLEGAQVLASALEMDCYRELELLDLSNTDLDDESLICILQALQRANRKHLNTLYLADNNITDKGLAAIADALAAGVFVAGDDKIFSASTISIYNNPFTNEGLKEIIRGLTHPNCPNDLSLNASNTIIDNQAAELFIEMYQSGLCQEKLKIELAACGKIQMDAHKKLHRARLQNEVRYHAERSLALYQGLQQDESPISLLNKNRDCMTLITQHLLPDFRNFDEELRKKFNKKPNVFANNVHSFYKRMQVKRNETNMLENTKATNMPGLTT